MLSIVVVPIPPSIRRRAPSDKITISWFPCGVAHLLIVWHSQSGGTKRLVDAAVSGAESDGIDGVELRVVRALDGTPDDLRWADGVLFGTPENFGYMSGAMKVFLDRTFYEVETKTVGMPWSMFVNAGNDGTGATGSVERIVTGLGWKQVLPPVIARGDITPADLDAVAELGASLAGGLSVGIFHRA